jgi:hypothetical protein
MRWLRLSDDPAPIDEAALERVEPIARALEAAAHEAPPSLRSSAIRASLLENLDREAAGSATAGWLNVALAAAILVLVALVSVGAPSAIGSMIGDLLQREPGDPSPPLLPVETPALDDRRNAPEPVLTTTPSPDGTPPDPMPTAAETEADQPTPEPASAPAADPPGGRRDPLPTPPVTGPPGPLPTPPPPGPPDGAPPPGPPDWAPAP